ncbi:hypothetical protein [Geotalea sp. SG265]|uniref:hypothetical protein n=1 Tax=Geotalea sp. SG265 TaxID=2922867 RepID=UPI001FAF8F2A|nr:hypothetical protein [Geotalea sp. SG265]
MNKIRVTCLAAPDSRDIVRSLCRHSCGPCGAARVIIDDAAIGGFSPFHMRRVSARRCGSSLSPDATTAFPEMPTERKKGGTLPCPA